MVISERVSVPVLSEQITDADPSVSTDDSVLDDGVAFGHALHTEREHHRQDGGQALRYGSHGQRHPEQQHVHQVGGVADLTDEQDGAHHHAGDRDHREAERAPDARDLLSSGVGSSTVASSSAAILPIWVSMPVAVTSARPCPAPRRALEDHVEPVAQCRRLGRAWRRP